eukprot:7013943-Alexandrium_andersonii.AAC.1
MAQRYVALDTGRTHPRSTGMTRWTCTSPNNTGLISKLGSSEHRFPARCPADTTANPGANPQRQHRYQPGARWQGA